MHPIEAVAVPVIDQGLAASGWRRSAGAEPGFSMAGPAGLRYNVSLNLSQAEAGIRMLPALGVEHVETSRLVIQFKGLPAARLSTFGRALADLLKDGGYPSSPFARWLMESAADGPAVADRFLEDMQMYGMPFFRSFSNLDDILVQLRQRRRNNPTDYALTVALALAGERADAIAVLRDIATEALTATGADGRDVVAVRGRLCGPLRIRPERHTVAGHARVSLHPMHREGDSR